MCDHTRSRLECACNVNVELDTRFELPLSECSIVNSCNGLLCLSGPSDSDLLIVCNPVIGEFMKLPVPKMTKKNVSRGYMNYGISFAPESKLYKVVKLSNCWLGCDGTYAQGMMAEALTLGSDSWKYIGFYVFKDFEKIPPTYVNGFLYWFSDVHPVSIFSFDIQKELFEPVEAPPVKNTSAHGNNVGMGVLGEELCMTAVAKETFWTVIVDVWLMKDCGIRKEWSKVYSLNLDSNLGRLCFGLYKPIKYLNDGALLMSQGNQNLLIYKDPRKSGFRCLKLPDYGRMEVIAHSPSFVSLKNALLGHNVKVLNVVKSSLTVSSIQARRRFYFYCRRRSV